MKTLGIIGGTGPESTIDYYRSLIAAYRMRTGDGSYPPLLINSVDNQRLLRWVGENKLTEISEYLLREIWKLKRAGADLGLLAANTSHIVFDVLERESPIPLLSIVEVTRAEAQRRGLRRVGLFGTRFTMQADFYPKVFGKAGIAVAVPGAADQDCLHEKYMSELIDGIFLPKTRAKFLAIAKRLKETEKIEALILGGTELPLLLRGPEDETLPFLDTAKIHVEAAVVRMLS